MAASSSTEGSVRFATLAAVAMVAQQVAGRAASNTLFLTYFPVELLPRAMAVSAALSAFGVFAFARVLTRRGPARSVPLLFAVSGALFFGEWLLSYWAPQLSALAVYGHTALFGATLTSAFWSLVNERFDPFTARRVVSRITSGSTVGGVVGGLVAWRIGQYATVIAVPIGLGTLSFGAALLARPVARSARPSTSNVGGAPEASATAMIGTVRKTPYLRALAGLVLLGALIQSLLDFSLNAEAAATYGKGEKLLTFFAFFYTLTGILSFALQSTVTKRALETFGLAGTMAALPGSVVVALLARPFLPPLAEAAVVRGTESTVRGSLYRAGYELLYTPLPQREKRPTKMLIDVGFDRLGSALGAVVSGLVLLLPQDFSERVLAGVTMALAIVSFSVSRALHRFYVQALEKNLRSGVLRLDQQEVVDATTRRTLTETLDALDRKRMLKSLLAEVESLRTLSRASLPVPKDEPSTDPLHVPTPSVPNLPPSSFPPPGRVPSLLGETPEPRGGVVDKGFLERGILERGALDRSAPGLPPNAFALAGTDVILATLADVRSGDPARVRRALTSADVPESVLVPHVVPLLGRDSLTGDAQRFLRAHASHIAGQLSDALVDKRLPPAVRRQIPRVLTAAEPRRAFAGLIAALDDDDFDLRFRAALAASRVVAKAPELRLPHEQVKALVLREVEVLRAAGARTAQGRKVDPDDTASFGEGVPEGRRRLELELLFTLLSLSMDREPLRLAFLSLVTDDNHLRGTALEYLTAVLPEDLREALWPFLGGEQPPQPVGRTAPELSRELESSRSSIGVFLQAIRERESGRDNAES